MRFTFFQIGLFLLGLVFVNQSGLARKTPQPFRPSQTNLSSEYPCLPKKKYGNKSPNLVLGKVTKTQPLANRGNRYLSEVVVTKVFTGDSKLLDRKFEVESFGGEIEPDFQRISPLIQPEEIGIWLVLLSSSSSRELFSDRFEVYSYEFPCRKNVHPEFEQVLELAQVASEFQQMSPELQTQLMKNHAINSNREVSLFAVSWLLDTECPDNIEYLKQMFFEGKLPVLSQLYFDGQMGNVYSKQPSAAEQWRNQPERWTWIFQLSQHCFDPREAWFYRSSCWNTIYLKPLNPNYFRGLVNRTARNTSLPFKDRQGIFHFAIQREVEEKSLSGREAVDEYLWFIEQNVNQPGIDKTWYYFIFLPVTQPQIDRMSQLIKMTTNPEVIQSCESEWKMCRDLFYHSKHISTPK